MGTFAEIICIHAVMNTGAKLFAGHHEISDPHIKLRIALFTAMIPLGGILLAFIPGRFLTKLLAKI
jgi:hypothetical protein